MTTSGDLKRLKAKARRELRAARDAMPEEERVAAAEDIAESVLRIAGHGSTVMVFLSFGSEVPTDAIVERLAESGHRVAVPWLSAGEIVPVAYRPGDPVEPGAFGIREPVRHEPVDPRDIDVVLAPGLGFDRSGRRVGYGGGYYDRLLRRVRDDTLRVGIGFHQQIVDEVPGGRFDQSLDMIVTDRETITCRPG